MLLGLHQWLHGNPAGGVKETHSDMEDLADLRGESLDGVGFGFRE